MRLITHMKFSKVQFLAFYEIIMIILSKMFQILTFHDTYRKKSTFEFSHDEPKLQKFWQICFLTL